MLFMFNAYYRRRVGFVFENEFQKHITHTYDMIFLLFVKLFYLFCKNMETIEKFKKLLNSKYKHIWRRIVALLRLG